MKKIWKYPITLEPFQDIEMPVGAKILSLHKQGSRHEDEIYIWCLVKTENEREIRHFMFVQTGDEILCNNDECEYVGTLWLMNGSHVLHLLELKKGT